MEKIVIIINGSGGVGKDTLCEVASKYFSVINVSAITPIKEIAYKCGWDGEKNDKSRKFLSDLKRILVDFNDFPNEYLKNQYNKFIDSNNQIMFIHIREATEIDKFKQNTSIPCVTLLVKRNNKEGKKWGNESDDNVEKYEYDYCYENTKSLIEMEKDFINYLSNNILSHEE